MEERETEKKINRERETMRNTATKATADDAWPGRAVNSLAQ